jgi:hypothetical protein
MTLAALPQNKRKRRFLGDQDDEVSVEEKAAVVDE